MIVDIGIRGFLPASLVELRRVRDLTPYIGKQVEARIIELDKMYKKVANPNTIVLGYYTDSIKGINFNKIDKVVEAAKTWWVTEANNNYK